MQLPTAFPVTVVPLILQTVEVVLVNLTSNPEDAVADTVPVPPTTILGEGPKLIVWLVLPYTAKEASIARNMNRMRR